MSIQSHSRPLQASREFFERHITCWSCGAHLTAKPEHVEYSEGVDGANPNEYFYCVSCGKCLIITIIPSGLVPPWLRIEARRRYRQGASPQPIPPKSNETAEWVLFPGFFKLIRAILRGKEALVQVKPIGRGAGSILNIPIR